MARVVLAVAGAAIGSYFGGSTGAAIGGTIGGAVGGYIDNSLFPPKGLTAVGPRLGDLNVQVSTYGNPIARVYGSARLAGNMIWAQNIKENQTTTDSGGGKGGGSPSTTTTTYTYTATLAIAICEGPIDGVLRIWADSELLTDDVLQKNTGKYNVYLGTESQTPDPIMESFDGAGNVPAYRGVAYIVVEDFPLANFGNRIPNFTFEVKRTLVQHPALEDKVKAIHFIPGAGEFVYDTVVESQKSEAGSIVHTINNYNMHNPTGKADALLALDQLQATFPNLEYIGLVICWFGTSTDAGSCDIEPKVEFNTANVASSPDPWAVAGYTRSTADVVNHFGDGTPTYGGTPSDASVINIIKEIKNRGLKIMFYPLIFVDTITPESKPWRGRIIPANTTDCNAWFTKTKGYNNFIEHYANLSVGGYALKDHVDAFVIGSEYVGITSFTESTGVFPGVTKFKTVASNIKTIVGSSVKVLYAADWSEYHHTTDGWYNMDPLWSDTNIDVVGIDCYMPLTPDLPQSQITYDKVYAGWTKDEGWDYYWNADRTVKTSFSGFAYAWKNIGYFWAHTHTNPDATVTDWTAKMKPLWLSEFGFPSVDGCSNQPNVFVDPSSVESFYPRGSKHRVDFQAQRTALTASIDFWNAQTAISGNTHLVENKFVWTWDARPYPYWPNLTNVWADAPLWITGHWLNGKAGTSTLGAVVAQILTDAGIASYDVSQLTALVGGYVLNAVGSARSAIETLAVAYLFDLVESSGNRVFVPRGQSSVVTVPQDNLIPPASSGSGGTAIKTTAKITRMQELDLPAKYTLTYLNSLQLYQPNTQVVQRQTTHALNELNYNWPLVLGDQEAANIAQKLLYADWIQRTSYQFTLPPQYAYIEPTDVITLTLNGVNHEMRVVSTSMQKNGSQTVNAVAQDISAYDFYVAPGSATPNTEVATTPPPTGLYLMDLPPLPQDSATDDFLTFGVLGLAAGWKGSVIYRSDDGGVSGGNTYNLLAQVNAQSVIGNVNTTLGDSQAYTWDNSNTLSVTLINGTLSSVTELAVLNGANAALVGGEVIQFQNATLTGTNTYTLSKLLRGRLGTEDQVSTHTSGEIFILLDGGLTRITMALNSIGVLRYYKPVTVGATLGNTTEQNFTYTARQLKPFSPVQITGARDGSSNLTITWIRRARVGGDLRDGVDVPLSEQSEAYQVDILNGSTVVRTIATTSPTASYSAADQTTDFGSPQSSVSVKVYQMSAAVGRGIPGVATV